MLEDDPQDAVDTSTGEPPPDEADTPNRREGAIQSARLDEDAVRVVRRLQRNGHEAYLVGGCVRDLLCGLEPKDFDVATDAHPNRIKRLFRNARIIGRRFRLAHIRFGRDHVVETSTFRGIPAPEDLARAERLRAELEADAQAGHRRRADHRHSPENVFGTAPEDARRRDFTINALFYDPLNDQILDWVGGLEDLEARLVRSIGDPAERLREDPVRMIRAVHFAERLDFQLEPGLEQAIRDTAQVLEEASNARLYIELLKVLSRASAYRTLRKLHELGALAHWLPELVELLERPVSWPTDAGGTHEEAQHGETVDAPEAHAMWMLLGAADRWGLAAHGEDDALVLAPLVGPWVIEAWAESPRQGYTAFGDLFDDTVRPLARRMSIPRRTLARMKEMLWVWLAMREAPDGRRSERLASRRAFPLALRFLRLDLMARDCGLDLYRAWEALGERHGRAQHTPGDEREDERRPPRGASRRGRGRRRGRRGGRRQQDGEDDRGLSAEADAWAPAPEPGDGPQ